MASKRFFRLVKIFTGTNSGEEGELLQLEGRVERFAHFWVLVIKSFIRNRCFVRSSALAYTTLLALIPLLAVAVSISGSLLKTQGEDQIYHAIDKFVSNIMPPAAIGTNTQGATLNLSPQISVPLTPTNFSTQTNLILATTNVAAPKRFFLFGPPKKIAETRFIITVKTNFVNDTNVIMLVTNLVPQETRITAQKEAAKKIHDYIQNAQNGALGVTGMAVFIFIAIMMFSRVEDTFNDIWGVARGRTWLWRIVLYWTTITLGPLLLITATGLAGGAHFQNAKNFVSHNNFCGEFLWQLVPIAVLCLTFTLIYLLVPNTKVRFSAAAIGGLVAGSLWHLNSAFGFLYVSRVVTNSKIYGGLGLVPVFMLGLYFSWVILLFGAQVAYAFQNRAAYLQEKLADNVNQRGREFVALRIMTLLGQRFQNGLKPASVIQLSAELGVPSRLTQQILRTLAAAQLVTEVGGAENGYVPARPLETINAHHILMALRSGSGRELILPAAPALAEIYGDFSRIEEAERAAAEKISLLLLVQRAPQIVLDAPKKTEIKKQISVAEKTSEIQDAPEPEIEIPESKTGSETAGIKTSKIPSKKKRDLPL